ncbi:MAG TPA: LamG domain-containing protein [Puia sp.]|nr:LamG domain-containing protein [Puia sp.]
MRILRLIPLFLLLPFFFTLSGIPFSSCEKKTVVHDTTTVYDTSYDLTSGLVAYYNFNKGSLNDSSVYHNNITFNNATPAKDRHGIDGNAYSFNGTSSYMRVPNSPSLNPDNITLDVIIKVNGFNNGACKGNAILDKGSADEINGLYVMRYSDSIGCSVANYDSTREVFYGSYGDNIPSGTTAGAGGTTVHVTTGIWYMLTYTYDGLNAKFYVNGELKDSRPFSIPFTDNANDLYIGRKGWDQYPYWVNGVIDEIRIYNRALPPQALKQLYNQMK